MDNPLQTLAPPKYEFRIFEHPQFGVIRIVIINGEIWFVAVDVCRALEIKNPRDAFSRLDEDEKKSIVLPNEVSTNGVTNSVDSADGTNDATSGWIENRVNVVNEPGLYRLIFSSRKKEAREFQRWVYHEVLPAIRQYGYYSLVSSTAPVVAKREKNQNRVNGQLTDACVYVAHKKGNFNIVKIGQSNNPRKRVAQIKDMDCDDIYQTFRMPRKDARTSESICLEYHAPFKLEGEFFCANFYDVCRFIKVLVKGVAKFKPVSETTVRKAITDLKAFINDPSIKKLAAPPTK